ncbi:MAG: transcriptional repressor [Chlorobi bacterium]|nr:transcriptional repressor [Chlorobiota bacterium]
MKSQEISKLLKGSGLKVTPQRMLIMEIISGMYNHPTAEMVISRVQEIQPGISPATVYKTLDTLVRKKLICKISTDDGIMRYDPVTLQHHHLYSTTSGKIKDFYDEELNRLLREYFNRKKIPGFELEDFRLELNGKFDEESTSNYV